MPENALERVPDAQVTTLEEMPGVLTMLVRQGLEGEKAGIEEGDPLAEAETRFAELSMAEVENEIRAGEPSQFACPECGGVLWEIDQHGMLRYRCRVGHAYTAQHLKVEQKHAVESALWAALRALEENASLYRRMASRGATARHLETRRSFEERAENAESNARRVRDFLVNMSLSEQEWKGTPGLTAD